METLDFRNIAEKFYDIDENNNTENHGMSIGNIAFCPNRDRDGLTAVTADFHEWNITTDAMGMDIGAPDDYNDTEHLLFMVDENTKEICEIWKGEGFSMPDYDKDKVADWLNHLEPSVKNVNFPYSEELEIWIRLDSDIAEELMRRDENIDNDQDVTEFFLHGYEVIDETTEISFEFVNSLSGNPYSMDVFPKNALERVKVLMADKLKEVRLYIEEMDFDEELEETDR